MIWIEYLKDTNKLHIFGTYRRKKISIIVNYSPNLSIDDFIKITHGHALEFIKSNFTKIKKEIKRGNVFVKVVKLK